MPYRSDPQLVPVRTFVNTFPPDPREADLLHITSTATLFARTARGWCKACGVVLSDDEMRAHLDAQRPKGWPSTRPIVERTLVDFTGAGYVRGAEGWMRVLSDDELRWQVANLTRPSLASRMFNDAVADSARDAGLGQPVAGPVPKCGNVRLYEAACVINAQDDSTELCELLGDNIDDASLLDVDIGSEVVVFDKATGKAVPAVDATSDLLTLELTTTSVR